MSWFSDKQSRWNCKGRCESIPLQPHLLNNLPPNHTVSTVQPGHLASALKLPHAIRLFQQQLKKASRGKLRKMRDFVHEHSISHTCMQIPVGHCIHQPVTLRHSTARLNVDCYNSLGSIQVQTNLHNFTTLSQCRPFEINLQANTFDIVSLRPAAVMSKLVHVSEQVSCETRRAQSHQTQI